jgi:hypothetical protein
MPKRGVCAESKKAKGKSKKAKVKTKGWGHYASLKAKVKRQALRQGKRQK